MPSQLPPRRAGLVALAVAALGTALALACLTSEHEPVADRAPAVQPAAQAPENHAQVEDPRLAEAERRAAPLPASAAAATAAPALASASGVVRVTDARSSLPVAGCEVTLASAEQGASGVVRTHTDAGGAATFLAVAAGRYRVSATAAIGAADAPAPLEVRAGTPFSVALALRTLASVRGTAETAAGAPLAGAAVEIRALVQGEWKIWPAAAPTAADGSWSVDRIALDAPVEARACARRGGFEQVERVEFALAPGAVIDAGPLRLAPFGATVTGVALDEFGAPLRGLACWLIDVADGSARRYTSALDDSGAFRFEGVAAGRYALRVDGFCASSGGRVDAAVPEPADGRAVDAGTLGFTRPAFRIAVRVVTETGEGAGGATVTRAGEHRFADGAGRCEFAVCGSGSEAVRATWSPAREPLALRSGTLEAAPADGVERVLVVAERGAILRIDDAAGVLAETHDFAVNVTCGADAVRYRLYGNVTRMRLDVDKFAGREIAIEVQAGADWIGDARVTLPPDVSERAHVIPISLRRR